MQQTIVGTADAATTAAQPHAVLSHATKKQAGLVPDPACGPTASCLSICLGYACLGTDGLTQTSSKIDCTRIHQLAGLYAPRHAIAGS
jgi:hypothetical protein